MQLIKKKDLLNLIGEFSELLDKTMEVILLKLTKFQLFTGSIDKSELEMIVHKPPQINPNLIAPRFQPGMHEKIRQFSR